MRTRDTFDVLTSSLALVCDAVAIFAGIMLAVYIRFDTGWIPLYHDHLPPRSLYVYGAGVATLLFLFIFGQLGLYRRPQTGHFTEKIPRIVRACGLGIVLAIALAFAIRTEPPFSRLVTGIAFFTVTFLVVVERNILFQLERHWAKYGTAKKNIVILGTGAIAVRLKRKLESEHRLRSSLVGFFRTDENEPDPDIPRGSIKGSIADFSEYLETHDVDEVILANPSTLPHEQMVDMIIQCEKRMANFHMVPDMFRLLTSSVEVQSIDGIPLLGIGKWPLDYFWNRMLKRLEDIAGALVGLVISAPIIAVVAPLVKLSSPGPLFYRQERCGEKGRPFRLYKLRTMSVDAEAHTGPVWATQDDPRRTRVGAYLRRYNLDELPQFWNVLRGEMSLVGPRPERPHFVEQFKDDIGQYMWRHVSKPGMTGLAQVNGYRGNTSLDDRIKHDLYYLENWSLSLDFKILAKTFVQRKNAY